ncbi:hypothetical protein, partial [Aeromonas veronii]|uniref:hypothetical protein n=1 Tax=Aeromonas veronii TaxID=654 RepID=UPI003BA03FD3
SVSHLVPSGSPFIGGKGVNHIQDGTQETKRPPHRGGLFVFSIIYFLHHLFSPYARAFHL